MQAHRETARGGGEAVSFAKDDLELADTSERAITGVCRRGAHDNCTGIVLKNLETAESPEAVERVPCECTHHGQPDAEFRRKLARGDYPGRHTSRWA